MTQFKDLQSMYEAFKKSAIEAVNDVVPPKFKECMKEAIEIEVYMAYEPTLYTDRRKKSGGLQDIRNMKHDLVITKNSVKIMLKNYTKGDNRGNYSNTQPYEYIDTIIVSGEGYSWKNSKIAQIGLERDFYTKTEELLRQSNVIQEIKKEMKRKGW